MPKSSDKSCPGEKLLFHLFSVADKCSFSVEYKRTKESFKSIEKTIARDLICLGTKYFHAFL